MNFTEENIDEFLNTVSFTGLKASYFLKFSFEKKTAFNFKETFAKLFPNAVDYCYGFFIACASFGLFSFNYKDGILTVTDINPIFSRKIKDELLSRFPSDDKRKKEIEIIEKYF